MSCARGCPWSNRRPAGAIEMSIREATDSVKWIVKLLVFTNTRAPRALTLRARVCTLFTLITSKSQLQVLPLQIPTRKVALLSGNILFLHSWAGFICFCFVLLIKTKEDWSFVYIVLLARVILDAWKIKWWLFFSPNLPLNECLSISWTLKALSEKVFGTQSFLGCLWDGQL